MNKKPLAFVALIFLCALFICMTVSSVSSTTLQVVNPNSGVVNSQVNVQGTIDTPNGNYSIRFGDLSVVNGTSDGNSVNATFTVPTLPAGNYNITLQDTTSNQSGIMSFVITVPLFSFWPALSILGVSLSLAFINSGLNRILISRFVGWNDYQTMQKETREWRSQQMAAMRAKDQKQIDKLKKKESQMMNMQKKMMKPQLILFALTFSYFLIWPILTGFFPQPVVHVPGFGVQPFFIWYLMCSLFFGTFASRIIGIMPLE